VPTAWPTTAGSAASLAGAGATTASDNPYASTSSRSSASWLLALASMRMRTIPWSRAAASSRMTLARLTAITRAISAWVRPSM
jgi:hypothetical protein